MFIPGNCLPWTVTRLFVFTCCSFFAGAGATAGCAAGAGAAGFAAGAGAGAAGAGFAGAGLFMMIIRIVTLMEMVAL